MIVLSRNNVKEKTHVILNVFTSNVKAVLVKIAQNIVIVMFKVIVINCNHHHTYVTVVTNITHALMKNVNTMGRKPMICIWQSYMINALDLMLQKMN